MVQKGKGEAAGFQASPANSRLLMSYGHDMDLKKQRQKQKGISD